MKRGRASGLLRFHPRVRDDLIDERGERTPGTSHVGDTAIEFELQLFEPIDAGSRFRIYLVEQADTFEVAFEYTESAGFEAVFTRWYFGPGHYLVNRLRTLGALTGTIQTIHISANATGITGVVARIGIGTINTGHLAT